MNEKELVKDMLRMAIGEIFRNSGGVDRLTQNIQLSIVIISTAGNYFSALIG